MEDKRNRSDKQHSGNQPREKRRRDRKSGGSMESPGSRRPPREDQEEPQE